MKFEKFVIRALCLLGLWLGLGLQAHAQTDTVTYVYTDPQGTPLVEADASGNVIARYDYTPYGSSIASLGNPPNGPGYTGHVNDPETGLVYMQARYYQPTGRFLSPDPVGPSPGNVYSFNRYVYADNNPIANIDPDGRCADADFSCGARVRSYGKWADTHPKEADKIGLYAGVPATALMAAPTVIVAADAVPAAVVMATRKFALRAIYAYLSLDPSKPYPTDSLFNPLDPPGETQMGDQMEKIAELWKKLTEYMKDKETTPTEPKSSSQPAPEPQSQPQHQQSPSSTAPQSLPTPQRRVVTPTLHSLDE